MPENHYCWRCKMIVPMLTDDEWEEIRPLLLSDMTHIMAEHREPGVGLKEAIAKRENGACQRYFEITGFPESNANAIWHHTLSTYGPECGRCGHLLRTPHASFCANCGATTDFQ